MRLANIRLKDFGILTILLVVFVGQSNAQNSDTTNYQKVRLFTFNLEFHDTQNGFDGDIQTNAQGLSATWLFQKKTLGSFFYGPSLEWHRFHTLSSQGANIVENQNVNGAALQLQLRYYPDLIIGPLEAYFEGFVGPRVIFSTFIIEDSFSGDQLNFEIDELDFGFSFGAGVGVSINLSQNLYYLNFAVNTHYGSSFEFLTPIRDQQGNNTGNLELKNARYEVLRYQLGFSLSF